MEIKRKVKKKKKINAFCNVGMENNTLFVFIYYFIYLHDELKIIEDFIVQLFVEFY